MKFTDLKKSLDDGESFSVYLIEGEDAYFRNSAVKSIKDKFIEAPEINFVSFDGETLDVSEFTASLSALPFMSKKRMTAVREFYPKADGIKGEFKDFLSAPPAESLLVVVNEKPCESLKKYPSVCVIDCQKADEVTLARWIIAYLKKRNVELLWQNYDGLWDGHAPVLFPFCGHCAVKLDGKDYNAPAHGIVRYHEFSRAFQTGTELVLTFKSDA